MNLMMTPDFHAKWTSVWWDLLYMFDPTKISCAARGCGIYFMKAANGISLIAILCWPDHRMIDASDVPSHPVPRGKITTSASQRSALFASLRSISHCCPARHFAAWVELNGVLWCEWDVSSKNIAHQKVLPGRSATSLCAHLPHALASFFPSGLLSQKSRMLKTLC